MLETTIEFIKKKARGRKLLIWGAWDTGYEIWKSLKENGLDIAGYIDSSKFGTKYCGYSVVDPSIVCQDNIEKYYIIISIIAHQSVYASLYRNGFVEFEDYLYFGKSVFLATPVGYQDVYGNCIRYLGTREGGSDDPKIEIAAGSSLNIEDGVKFGKNISIKVTHFSEVWIKKGVKIFDNAVIEAHRGGKIVIEPGCMFEKGTILLTIKGKILIGSKTTFGHNVNIRISHDSVFQCGKDCMFAYDIKVRGEDGHTIIDTKRKEIMSRKKDVEIGNHIWVGMGSTLFAGTIIGDNSIVGANSFVNNHFPSNCLIIGTPARIYKTDIAWDRRNEISYAEWENENGYH